LQESAAASQFRKCDHKIPKTAKSRPEVLRYDEFAIAQDAQESYFLKEIGFLISSKPALILLKSA